jgi:hypothetical protein
LEVTQGDWLSTILDQHDQTEAAFAAFNGECSMLYPLMNIVGPVLLLAAIVWATFYTKNRSRRMDRKTDEGTRRLRDELNEEDTAGRRSE